MSGNFDHRHGIYLNMIKYTSTLQPNSQSQQFDSQDGNLLEASKDTASNNNNSSSYSNNDSYNDSDISALYCNHGKLLVYIIILYIYLIILSK